MTGAKYESMPTDDVAPTVTDGGRKGPLQRPNGLTPDVIARQGGIVPPSDGTVSEAASVDKSSLRCRCDACDFKEVPS